MRYRLIGLASLSPGSCLVMAFARWGSQLSSKSSHGLMAVTSSQSTSSIGHNTGSPLSPSARAEINDDLKTVDVLSLESIRSSLIRQEETIIFALIERAQFRCNPVVYEKGGFGRDLGIPAGSQKPTNEDDNDGETTLSLFEYMMIGTEALHCAARRYLSPEEHPFYPERLPMGPLEALPELFYRTDLLSSQGGANQVNFNKRLLDRYLRTIVPALCQRGDDEQYGSAALCDIAALQALSRRVHYGKFVAESKYQSNPDEYQRLVDAGDAEGVMARLTNIEVEEKVLRRARLKAATYGTEPILSHLPPIEGSDPKSSLVAAAAASAVVSALDAVNSNYKGKVDPYLIEDLYRNIIIPMTKDIEVAYLFRRCGKEPPAAYQE